MRKLLLLFFVLTSLIVFAGESDSTSKRSLIVVPIGYYTPETSLGFGGAGGYYFKSNNIRKISSISYSAIYTVKNQFIFHVAPKIYSKNKKYYYYADLGINYYPDIFYGIGKKEVSKGTNFISRFIKLNFQPQRYVSKNWAVGVNYFLRYEEPQFKEESLVEIKNLHGSKSFFVQAVGLLSSFDTRNNLFYTEKGFFSKISCWFSSSYFGSDYSSDYYNLDIRHYIPLGKKHIFAYQFYSAFVTGNTPFQFLQTIGGRDRMRGFREGMFLNNAVALLQSEYRFPIYKRFKGTLFGGVGQVFDVNNYTNDKLKVSYGAGLRYRLNDARVHLRFDYAFTNYGTSGFYITATEAF